ncbi:hypothetical protein ACFWGP_05350 [Agromyces sp. NPDC127015]|uniref:hypothetical protein n=1 Tax=Agromyces sp. NPDC127015 TaxID=3347108 RepID=UPI0036665594
MSNTTKPTAKPGRQPADRKTTAAELHEAELANEELLVDMPTLKPPHQLRIREKNRVYKLLFSSGFISDTGDITITDDKSVLEQLPSMLDMAADVDDFAESIAVDKQAYAAWSEGKDFDVFFAILNRYASAVGESTSSAS